MRHSERVRPLLVSVLVVVSVLALPLSEIAAPTPDYGFGNGGQGSDEQCAHLVRGEPGLIGEVLEDPGGRIVLQSATLAGASGVEVLHAWAIPLAEGGSAIGTASSPPQDFPAWQRRQSLPSGPLRPHQNVNIVLEVEKTGPGVARAAAMRIVLDQGGALISSDSGTRYTFPDRC